MKGIITFLSEIYAKAYTVGYVFEKKKEIPDRITFCTVFLPVTYEKRCMSARGSWVLIQHEIAIYQFEFEKLNLYRFDCAKQLSSRWSAYVNQQVFTPLPPPPPHPHHLSGAGPRQLWAVLSEG